MLVDFLDHRTPKDATEATVLGPFYREVAPAIANGGSIALAPSGEPCKVAGRILDPKGRPVAGAVLDVWQTAANGMYEGQEPDQPPFNLRGRLRSDAKGGFSFETVLPVSYPIPHDGPVGKMLKATGRHPYRPAHIHLVISAPGYQTITTQIFVKGDAVFALKDSLVEPFRRRNGRYEMRRDFVLAAEPKPRTRRPARVKRPRTAAARAAGSRP
jgi:catechol 1,2-dioxygenase